MRGKGRLVLSDKGAKINEGVTKGTPGDDSKGARGGNGGE